MPRVTGFKMRGGDQDRMKEACSGDKDEWIINHMGSVLNGLEMFHYSHQCRRHYRHDLRKSQSCYKTLLFIITQLSRLSRTTNPTRTSPAKTTKERLQ